MTDFDGATVVSPNPNKRLEPIIYLRLDESMVHLDVSIQTILVLIAHGAINAVHIGGADRIASDELETARDIAKVIESHVRKLSPNGLEVLEAMQ